MRNSALVAPLTHLLIIIITLRGTTTYSYMPLNYKEDTSDHSHRRVIAIPNFGLRCSARLALVR